MASLTVRDFAYPPEDKRHVGIYEIVKASSEDEKPIEGHSYATNTHLFSTEDLIEVEDGGLIVSSILPSLLDVIHRTQAVDDGLKFVLYRAKIQFDFQKSTEWEMNAIAGEELYIAYRQDAQDGPNTTNDLVKVYLDPEPETFATQVREFVEYQKVYGTGWVTAVRLSVMGDKRYRIALRNLGLVPSSYVQRLDK